MKIKKINVFLAGHNGMAGKAIHSELLSQLEFNVITIDRKQLDLRDYEATKGFLKKNSIDVVIDAAALVGGIHANSIYPYDFLMQNLLIQNSLIKSSLDLGIKKFIFLGSSCIYPKHAEQPIKESELLTGSLEDTNQWYAIAKIAGLKSCQAIKKQFGYDYFSLMPTNLYGPHDNFDLNTSHVVPALIRKIHQASRNKEELVLWGTGSPKREFLHVQDLAKAVCFSLKNKIDYDFLNVGTGREITIKELAEIIMKIFNYQGNIRWDSTMPDGTPRKVLNIEKITSLGWASEIDLNSGLIDTVNWYLQNQSCLKENKLQK